VASAVWQNIEPRGRPHDTTPTEFIQKMNGTSILVELLYTG
jgi:hypothetical protein